MGRTAKVVVIFLFIVYLLIALGLYVFFVFYQIELDEKATISYHGLAMMLGFLIMGIAIVTFRITRGSTTRVIKYFHFLFHSIAILCYIIGIAVANRGGKEVSAPLTPTTAHILVGYHSLGCLAIQYILALFLFIYLYENKRNRLFFAPFHDIFGIWIYICFAGSLLTGIYYQFEAFAGANDSNPENKAFKLTQLITVPSYVCIIIVVAVVISPYLEWELEGPL